ncbi:pyrokinin-1 receptor-like isoform X1 [Rhopalosiphum maidis]|uniref:pyrokinin-1 receptor-like isoform X1 n=1 Tax=Rhopalosiphum maidis TaxID=43146 RepID=UPI000EFFB6F8|nr:pyrokinin-1 receptor-like isoform X1 [Rhopalosiphum maidis]XP_026815962.1 pyrokinin-1 receptor-like isoform X1 [Rhopalosiphum maidis]XP_026815963.1 pyrokinin-1 receptor-like isoform X1 [Rhopalosiphum maidis]XP_026815965.1 pyrokinin-1 receptor-like isoform X1 [Rhopalosiphum maidis]XP_026815966.1 pyrokinin-1 receptor-like isoform X1 [Rhopalosiphum maidis]XP_026815967.1 pyrokinin-1 receptor-like isoform X1 [Rhopalosiphum maidis]XP_026815968.1 pyrokinin-1 receptor-like isoform X1 [Rhopalosiphu
MSLQNDLYDDGGGKGSQLNLTAENTWDNDYIMPKRDPLYIVVPMTIMYSVIFVTGVIGNSITCMVIAKHKYMHTATNYYLFSLAMSDLILLVSGLPQEMWSIWSRYPYVFGEIFCQLRGLFSEMSANATVLTITAFTAERYVAICHPFMAQSMSKLSRAVKLIIIIWLVAVLFAIPQALQFTVSSWDGSSETMQCNIRSILLMNTDIELSTVSFTLSTLLFFLLPMTLITVLYILIGLRLRRSDKLKRTITVRSTHGEKKISSPEYRANSSPKVLKMLVAVVVAFFICWAPFHAQRLIAIFGFSHASSGNLDAKDIPFLHQLYGISTYISGVLYYVSTTINPILYHIMSLKFRGAFKETVLRCCGGDSGCGGDGWTGKGGKQQRPARWARRRLRSDSSEPTTDDRRPKYRRVSGRTTSSVDFPATADEIDDDDDDDEVCDDGSPVADAGQLADCGWRRSLTGLSATGNAERRHDSSCSNSAGSSGGNCDDTSAPAGARGRRLVKAPPAIALSNWIVISNSSLKDVDSDDLRDELVGYAADHSAAIRGETTYYY